MAWEWVAPLGAVAGAVAGGMIAVFATSRTQRRQHEFDRAQALAEHGRDRIDAALAALRFLRRHAREIAGDGLIGTGPEHTDFAVHHERLAEVIPYLADAEVRDDLELVRRVLGDTWEMERYSSAGRAPGIVVRACDAGIDTLVRHLRGEQREASPTLEQLRAALEETYSILDEQYELQLADRRAADNAAPAAREEPPTSSPED